MADIPQGRDFSAVELPLPPMITYAQNFEDVTLRRALHDIGRGFYVDLGANDPTRDSVTRWFYDQGWSGINVEPVPLFMVRRGQRPRDINLGVAVAGTKGFATLHVMGGGGLSTTLPSFVERAIGWGAQKTEEVQVETFPLDELLDEYAEGRTIDFLKIDCEGLEDEIIQAAAFAKHRPRIVVVEISGDGTYNRRMLEKGYHFVWCDGINRFYVREEDEWRGDLVARPPSYFDSCRHYKLVEAEKALREKPEPKQKSAWDSARAIRRIRRAIVGAFK